MDARVQQTRQALFNAFFSLVLTQRYQNIRIDTILARAGTARSTFYEHFRNKDELLAASLQGPFSVLAAAPFAPDQARLAGILQHFYENRALAPGIFAGPARRVVDRVLQALLLEHLRRVYGPHLIMSAPLVAQLLAQLLMGGLVAWLEGREQMDSDRLALALSQGASALLFGLCGPGINADKGPAKSSSRRTPGSIEQRRLDPGFHRDDDLA